MLASPSAGLKPNDLLGFRFRCSKAVFACFYLLLFLIIHLCLNMRITISNLTLSSLDASDFQICFCSSPKCKRIKLVRFVAIVTMAVELWSGLLLVVCIGKCAKDRLQRCFYITFKACARVKMNALLIQ